MRPLRHHPSFVFLATGDVFGTEVTQELGRAPRIRTRRQLELPPHRPALLRLFPDALEGLQVGHYVNEAIRYGAPRTARARGRASRGMTR